MNMDHDKSINSYQQLLQQKTGLILPAPKIIDSPNFINIEKVYAHYSDKPRAKFLNNPINAPKIPSLG